MPSRSRIIFAEYGVEKINSIDETIEKYGKFSAGELVDLTHREDTPWAVSDKGKYRDEIQVYPTKKEKFLAKNNYIDKNHGRGFNFRGHRYWRIWENIKFRKL